MYFILLVPYYWCVLGVPLFNQAVHYMEKINIKLIFFMNYCLYSLLSILDVTGHGYKMMLVYRCLCLTCSYGGARIITIDCNK